MTAQERVLAKYPAAESRFRRPIFRPGYMDPVQEGRWIICTGEGVSADVIGSGATEASAWEDAASQLG